MPDFFIYIFNLHMKFLLRMPNIYNFFFIVTEWERAPRRLHQAVQAQRPAGQLLWVGGEAPATSLGCVSLTAMYCLGAVPAAGWGGEEAWRDSHASDRAREVTCPLGHHHPGGSDSLFLTLWWCWCRVTKSNVCVPNSMTKPQDKFAFSSTSNNLSFQIL